MEVELVNSLAVFLYVHEEDPIAFYLCMESNTENQDLSPFKWMDMETLEQLFSGSRPTELLCYPASKGGKKRKQLVIEEPGPSHYWLEYEQEDNLEVLSSEVYEVVDLVSDADDNVDDTSTWTRRVVVFGLCAANDELASRMPKGRAPRDPTAATSGKKHKPYNTSKGNGPTWTSRVVVFGLCAANDELASHMPKGRAPRAPTAATSGKKHKPYNTRTLPS